MTVIIDDAPAVGYDELNVDAVLCGYPMRLRGRDRVEAVRRLAARGATAERVAHLLRLPTTGAATRAALRAGVHLANPLNLDDSYQLYLRLCVRPDSKQRGPRAAR